MYKLKELKNLNTINITCNVYEQITNSDEYKEYCNIKRNFNSLMYRIKNHCIKLTDNEFIAYIVVNDTMQFYLYNKVTYTVYFVLEVSDNKIYYKRINVNTGVILNKKTKYSKKIDETAIRICKELLVMINYCMDSKDTIVKVKRSNKRNNTNNSSKDTRKTYIVINKDKVIYEIHTDENIKRNYNRKINDWSVIGHCRHYKNGKTVWIKPYIKGKGNPDKKEYIIK